MHFGVAGTQRIRTGLWKRIGVAKDGVTGLPLIGRQCQFLAQHAVAQLHVMQVEGGWELVPEAVRLG